MKLDSYWTDSSPAFVPEPQELPAPGRARLITRRTEPHVKLH
jgi:hypothetical protein